MRIAVVNYLNLFLYVLLCGCLLTVSTQAQTGPQQTQSVVAGGGGASTSGSLRVDGTIGQSVTSASSGGAFTLESGFWAGAGTLTTSNLLVADVTGTYGSTVSLATTLTANGAVLNNQLITFSLNGATVGTATTDVNGVATLNNISLSGINGGTYPGVVNAQFAGDLGFAAGSGAGQLIVQPATPVLQVTGGIFGYDGQSHPASVSLVGINNEVLSPVTVAYNGAGSVPVNAGSYSITASFAGNQNYSPTINNQQSIVINQANQAINFGALSTKTYGDADFIVSATASSNLNVNFAATGSCTISGGTVHITGAGSCMITASQGGNINYNPAAGIAQTFAVDKANQTITFGALSSKTFGDADFNVSATTSSNLSIAFSATGNCAVSTTTVHLTSAGSCTITASQGGNINYNPAAGIAQTFAVDKANQTITFGALSSKTFGDADFNVNATTSANLAINFAVIGKCTVAGSTIHLTGSGACTISASQAGDTNYNPAINVPRTFSIAQAISSTAVTSSVNPSDLGQTVTFTATVTSSAGIPAGTVQFKDNGTSLGDSVPMNASGVATVTTSSLATGTHTVTAIYSGDTNFTVSTGTLFGGQVVSTQPTLSINDVTLAEGNSGTTSFTFTVTLSTSSSLPVTVAYATANGTATAGSDYQTASGTLTFSSGETQKTITVLVNGDTANEPDEDFFVNLSNPINVSILDGQGLGTIVNDDAPGIQFSAAAYTVNEDGVDAVITINRVGDLSQPATVDYATSDQAGTTPCNVAGGLASQRCDYEMTVRTLRFAAGESTRTILIPIIDDTYVEGPESFTLSLSNPTGAALGSLSAATVTIVDNDRVAGAQNPLDDTAFFVRQHYVDFLNREPDPAGFSFWVSNIDSCGADATCRAGKRVDTSAAFFLSIEFQQTGYLVYRTYQAAYGNLPNAPVPIKWSEFLPDTQAIGEDLVVNQAGWNEMLDQNQQAFMTKFVQRARFATAFPVTMTPGEFVDKLFSNSGAAPAGDERMAAINEFGAGTNTSDVSARARALRRVAENAVLAQKEFDQAFVVMQYFGYLRRDPNSAPDTDFSGYNFWLNKLDSFNGNYLDAEMVKSFLMSSEYRQRFGPQ